MKLFVLGDLEWKESQLVYHALAQLNIEALVLDSPKQPYVCLGLPQNPVDELDMEYCHANDIGIFRREIGGGIVFLNNDQVFYNLIVRRDRKDVPRIPENFFRKFLRPVIQALDDLGMKAEYRPLCDLLVNGRKISGNGGGEMGDCMVLAGGLMLDFDLETMSRIMRLGDDMRNVFHGLMFDNLTTVKKVTGIFPEKDEVYRALTSRFEGLLGPLEPAELTPSILEKMKELDTHYTSDEWFFQKGSVSKGREVKVREGVFLFHNEFLAGGEQMAIMVESADNNIIRVSISGSGDTAIHRNIEDRLMGQKYDKSSIEKVVLSQIGGKDDARN